MISAAHVKVQSLTWRKHIRGLDRMVPQPLQPDGMIQNGRAEIVDPQVCERFDLRLNEAVMQQIRKLEESILTADERLGNFRVGG